MVKSFTIFKVQKHWFNVCWENDLKWLEQPQGEENRLWESKRVDRFMLPDANSVLSMRRKNYSLSSSCEVKGRRVSFSCKINWDSKTLLFLCKTALFLNNSSLLIAFQLSFFYWNYQKVDFIRRNEHHRITTKKWKICGIHVMLVCLSKFSCISWSNLIFYLY